MSLPNEYDVGDRPRIYCSTKDAGNVPTDPTALTLKYKVGGGDVVTKSWPTPAEITKDSTGEFYFDLDITSDMNGALVQYRWNATGAVIGAAEGSFKVKQSAFY